MPKTDTASRAGQPGLFRLSGFASGAVAFPPVLDAFGAGDAVAEDAATSPDIAPGQASHTRLRTKALAETRSDAVMLCKCEGVGRGDFLRLAPPACLNGGLRHSRSPLTVHKGYTPRVRQDMLKRPARAGMGHCMGKHRRDEAVLLLLLRFGLGIETIRPGSNHFPVRPVDPALIAADNDPAGKWSYWLQKPELLPSRSSEK